MTKYLENCPLCGGQHTYEYHHDQKRQYLACSDCHLVFVIAEHLPTLDEERAVYDLHNNNPDDPGYRAFLNRLLKPLSEHIQPGNKGLDFGSGPGPTLSIMCKEQGYTVDNYDPYYAPQAELLTQHYDFICSTEVLEHIHWPQTLLPSLWQQIQPGGVLGIMTKRVSTQAAFKHWHYIKDPTHVRFYSDRSFEYLAQRFNATLYLPANDVAILVKNSY